MRHCVLLEMSGGPCQACGNPVSQAGAAHAIEFDLYKSTAESGSSVAFLCAACCPKCNKRKTIELQPRPVVARGPVMDADAFMDGIYDHLDASSRPVTAKQTPPAAHIPGGVPQQAGFSFGVPLEESYSDAKRERVHQAVQTLHGRKVRGLDGALVGKLAALAKLSDDHTRLGMRLLQSLAPDLAEDAAETR